MRGHPTPEPPLDARWLDALSQNCGELRGGGARFEDLYLEQKLELTAQLTDGDFEFETRRLEGVATRWRSPSRVILHARTGISTAAIGELLARHADKVPMPSTRLIPAPEMDPPRVWEDWARTLVQRLAPSHGLVRYISRRAAIVRGEGWTPISTPALVRVERGGGPSSALLAVWGHPDLGNWIEQLLKPAPSKTWVPPAGTELPVLFSAGTAGVFFHETVGHMAESDLARTGASPLADLLGATVAPPELEIIDDPTRTDLAGAFDYDDEGVKAVPVTLVHRGRFEAFLCDREGASHLRCGAGRGRRAAWTRPPVARLSNLIVRPGDTPSQDLEDGLEHGLVVTRIGGATVDPVSSRIILKIERGWEVRHGRRRRALAPCELTGNVLETLANIDPRIGDDPTSDWRLGWCLKDGVPLATGSEAPSLLVRGLEVL